MQKNVNVLINDVHRQLFFINFNIIFVKNSYFQQLCLGVLCKKKFPFIKYTFGYMKTHNQPVQYLGVNTKQQIFRSFLTECTLVYI